MSIATGGLIVAIAGLLGLVGFVRWSVRQGIDDAVKRAMGPEIEKIHARIDSHMHAEEEDRRITNASIQRIAEDVAYLRGKLG